MNTQVVSGNIQSPASAAGLGVRSDPDRLNLVDPIAVLMEQKRIDAGAQQTPLIRLDLEVMIRGGLALVETTRTYVNREEEAIEALLSIPVPVHATFFGLTARIGGKLHKAKAMPRNKAREGYEGAIDSGKAAVLHEEILRGVHALAVCG